MNYIKNNNFIKLILIYLSWWVILYSCANLSILMVGRDSSMYMPIYYTGAILLCYSIYLLIPLKFGNTEFKEYAKNIGFNLNKTSLTLSIILILNLIVLIKYSKINIGNLYWLVLLQPPLVEELIFRGLIPKVLSKYNRLISIMISSILFATIHILNNNSTLISMLIYTFIIGLILIILRNQCNSIVPGILIHYTINSNVYFGTFSLISIILIYEIFYILSRIKKRRITSH